MRPCTENRNHPMQPLAPKHQPWFRMQAPDRKVANVRTAFPEKTFGAPRLSIEQELMLRARLEQRSAEKLEKLHEAVSHDRFVRKRLRERVAGHIGEIVKQQANKARE